MGEEVLGVCTGMIGYCKEGVEHSNQSYLYVTVWLMLWNRMQENEGVQRYRGSCSHAGGASFLCCLGADFVLRARLKEVRKGDMVKGTRASMLLCDSMRKFHNWA